MEKRFSRKLLLLVIVCFGSAVSLLAQDLNLNYRETPIKIILKELAGQTGYSFVYSDAIKELDKKVTINFSQKKVMWTKTVGDTPYNALINRKM